MARNKGKTGVPNKHLHARISYLQQAATYLATAQFSQHDSRPGNPLYRGRDFDGNQKQESDQASRLSSPSHKSDDVSKEALSDGDASQMYTTTSTFHKPALGGLPLLLSSHLSQVARKTQIRLHPSIKHAICKRCNAPLIEDQTCTKSTENLSTGGRKPHADVLVLKCSACGATKRWPVGAKRQKRKTKREKGLSHASEQQNGGTNANEAN